MTPEEVKSLKIGAIVMGTECDTASVHTGPYAGEFGPNKSLIGDIAQQPSNPFIVRTDSLRVIDTRALAGPILKSKLITDDGVCATCRFFAQHPQCESIGDCRKKAPGQDGWPETRASYWCGEYETHQL